MEICCCPEMSKDTNGSTGTIELRWFLTQLEQFFPMPCSAKTQRIEGEARFILLCINFDTPSFMLACFLML